ncbi:hypothetical protein MOV76_25070 [Rhizobium sp. PRIMUS64]|uniref:hypothetical protein n=1 Tax=Rhizobium sp. PRIMUS64 TaxID=2908925 RepID=UPI001FF19E40|nr:hypothetical protein [Rhizobium sp. PRIMUS64]MCJ9694875.1 hypothetical protein [Rhizobium sp. PRIMUS64]
MDALNPAAHVQIDEMCPRDVSGDDSDRFKRCRDAIHLEFAALVDRAVAAGRADEVLQSSSWQIITR